MVVGECKFTDVPLDYGALASFEDHAAEIRWTPTTGDVDTEYASFTRSGATQSIQGAVSMRGNLQLFDSGHITEVQGESSAHQGEESVDDSYTTYRRWHGGRFYANRQYRQNGVRNFGNAAKSNGSQTVGSTFWFIRNRLSGSHSFLSATNRS